MYRVLFFCENVYMFVHIHRPPRTLPKPVIARDNIYAMNSTTLAKNTATRKKWRSSSENILPQNITSRNTISQGQYDIYPYHQLGNGKIFNGYASLADWIITQKNVRIDGYIGIFWDIVQELLAAELVKRGVSVKWTFLSEKMKAASDIDAMVAPFLGEPDSVWGKKCTLEITDFFHTEQLQALRIDETDDINIAIGIGAALLDWATPIIYLELPKNEIQYRFRAGALTNFGSDITDSQAAMYKRLYFVDWVILNAHKKKYLISNNGYSRCTMERFIKLGL